MKALDNEMSTLKCESKIKQVMYIAREFSFNNPLIFTEIVYF